MIFTRDWFSMRASDWLNWTAGVVIREALEIGSFEGRSACWILETLNPDRLTCIDPWPNVEVERRFDSNIVETGKSDRLCKLKGLSADVLPTLRERFDLIYVDGSHEGRDVLLDGLLSLRLLNLGGLLIFDDYEWTGTPRRHPPKPAIDAFLTLNDFAIEILHVGYQVAVKKRMP